MDNNLYINKKKKISEKKLLERYFDKLWPLNRSLTGNDVRKTHKILSEIIPLKTYEIKSGTKVNDWIVPKEWNVKSATLKDSLGNNILDFKENNWNVKDLIKKMVLSKTYKQKTQFSQEKNIFDPKLLKKYKKANKLNLKKKESLIELVSYFNSI